MLSASSSILNHIESCLSHSSSTVWFRLMQVSEGCYDYSFQDGRSVLIINVCSFQVVVDCCKASPQTLRVCETNSLLSKLVGRVKDGNDVLSQAVAVEMSAQLAATSHGYLWLHRHNVMSSLLKELDTCAENSFSSLIQPSESKAPFTLCNEAVLR